MDIEKLHLFLNFFSEEFLIIWKPPHESNECHELKKKKVSSKASLCFMLTDVYLRSNDPSDHEFLLTKLKFFVCLIQYKCVLNEALSRQYFPWKMKQCKDYLISMVLNTWNILRLVQTKQKS